MKVPIYDALKFISNAFRYAESKGQTTITFTVNGSLDEKVQYCVDYIEQEHAERKAAGK